MGGNVGYIILWVEYLLPAAILFPGILISPVEKLTVASPSSRLIISPNYPGEAISGGASRSESHGKLLL